MCQRGRQRIYVLRSAVQTCRQGESPHHSAHVSTRIGAKPNIRVRASSQYQYQYLYLVHVPPAHLSINQSIILDLPRHSSSTLRPTETFSRAYRVHKHT